MGSWFSNFHIRKNKACTESSVTESLVHLMAERGYQQTEDPECADGRIDFLLQEKSDWITLWSDLLPHDDPESCAAVASPLSANLHTEVMGIACFDSDYLYLNLIHADEKVDGWIGIGAGKEIGITRRNKITPWKKLTNDYAAFSDKAKKKYVIADRFLQDASDNLGMSLEQSSFSGDQPGYGKIHSLYFVQTPGAEKSAEVNFFHYKEYFPFFIGQESHVSAINQGAAGTGLSIYFRGPYVEQEEIVFTDVQLNRKDIQLTREQLKDGQWVYAYHDPNFPIPQCVSRRLRKEKRAALEYAQRISVSFTPQGNPRKILDITVAFVPHEHRQGGTQCNIWHPYGSKKAFIEHYNKITKRVRAIEGDSEDSLPFLNEADYDV